MKKLPVIFLVLCCWACENKPTEIIKYEAVAPKPAHLKKIDKVIDDTNLSEKLGFPKEFFNLENTRNFGTFHNDLLSIYLTKEVAINGFKSNDVALFFLDDKLVRIRYGLEQDIMDKLIDSLQLVPKNPTTLKKITMKLADRIISYRRALDSLENRNHFYLYEELPEYKHMLWSEDFAEARRIN